MAYVLALDQGTTSCRAIVLDAAGRVCGASQRGFAQHFPAPGLVEHDAAEIWSTQLACAREAIAGAGVGARDLAGVGITNQRETVVVWERATGVPVHPAIVWQDRRTADACDALRAAGLEPEIAARTGLLLDPYFSATKIRWILDHVPGAATRAADGGLAAGTIDSWLAWNLSGGRLHVTDASNASRTLLYNLETGDWDDALLDRFGVPRAMLPTIVDSSGVAGVCDVRLFGAPVPIAGIAGDQQAALFGQRCVRPGMAKSTYGTGCFVLLHTGDRVVRSRARLLSTVAWRIGGRTTFALEGSVFVAGAVIQWLRDGLGIIASADEVEALAASVPDTAGAHFVPALTGLGAPYWDPHARGLISGLTRGVTRAHIARAALQSIAWQTADLLGAMEVDAGVALEELRVDGGASRNGLLMQYQADILRVPIVRPRAHESTALGAAYLAGLATGVWRDAATLDALWSADRRFEPGMPDAMIERARTGWRDALARSRSTVP